MQRAMSFLVVLAIPFAAFGQEEPPPEASVAAPAEAGPDGAPVAPAAEPDAVSGEAAPSAVEVVDASPAGPCPPAPIAEQPEPGDRGDQQVAATGPARFDITLDGYLRVEAATFVPDRFFGVLMPASTKRDSDPQVGRSDGFGLADARLNLRAVYQRNLYLRLGFDGALAAYSDANDPIGVLNTGLKDAYLRYTFRRELQLFVGRFKPPFDVEELTPTEEQFFVHRSLESRGVRRHEGPHADLFGQNDTTGFAPGRQIGVMIGSDNLVTLGGSQLGYALAVTNGNSGDAALNDNDLPAVWLRLFNRFGARGERRSDEEGPATYELNGGGVVGLSAFYNQLTTGLAPARYRDRVVGAGLDAAYQLWAFRLQGQLLAAMLDPESRADVPTVYSLGGHVQLAVEVPGTGLFPAYRFAYLDPRAVTDDAFTELSPDVDRVMHHTVGLNYRMSQLPLVFNLEYTRSLEQGGRAMPNDRVEAAMQVTFQ